VELFLAGRLPFCAIPAVIREALNAHTPAHEFTMQDLERIDAETRRRTRDEFALTIS
jgi:1-deoxy-D-xylulose 5-phosphate reductoisomerase